MHETTSIDRPSSSSLNARPREIACYNDPEQLDAKIGIEEAVSELCPVQQEAVDLYFYQDNSLSEAGRALGVTESAVCVRLRNAKKFLRESLVSYDNSQEKQI